MSRGTWAGLDALVMGLGLQGGGVEVARFLARAGARVTATDTRGPDELRESVEALDGLGVRFALGGHAAGDFARADLVVANPAVRPDHPMIAAAREGGARVTSELELFLEACPARLVLVTGTQGKSSTAHLAAALLAGAGFDVHLGGNIGRSLLGAAASMGAEDVAVVEVSSYQLEWLEAPEVARDRTVAVAVTNVLPEHLERHGTIEAYDAAKRRILELAGPESAVVLCADDARSSGWSVERGRRALTYPESAPDLDRDPRAYHVSEGRFLEGQVALAALDDLRLPGRFQRANALMALALARALGAPPERLGHALRGATGLPHRLEDLGVRAGHRVWDNGVSTTPDSTRSALEALADPGGPAALTWLAGGRLKDLPLGELVAAARGRVGRLIAFGESAGELGGAFAGAGIAVEVEPDLPRAVALAFERMGAGEPLLFSPACASFDAYRNFADRARAFRGALPPREPDIEP